MKNSVKFVLAAALMMSSPALAEHAGDHGKTMDAKHKSHAMCMKAADADGDGMVSKTEWAAHHEAMFAKADKDGDGMISVTEAGDHHMMKHLGHEMKEEMKEIKQDAKDLMHHDDAPKAAE